MTLFLLSLLAGVLTVLAPCTISLLPVIVGGSLSGEKSIRRALVVIISLGIAVIAFTLLLKVSTALINVPQSFWKEVSGVIIVVLGLTMIFPALWEKLPFLNTLNKDSNKLLAKGYQKQNFFGDVLIGTALGPVFSSCSPTYFLIIATVLPRSISSGLIYLFAYALGLCGMLLLVTIIGQRIMGALGVASDPRGIFKRAIGVLFLVVGIAIFLGYDKKLELYIASNVFDVTKIEQTLLPKYLPSSPSASITPTPVSQDSATATSSSVVKIADSLPVSPTSSPVSALKPATIANIMPADARIMMKNAKYQKAPEITNPSGYVNTGGKPITIGEFRNKKVVLIDIWTYSCINCQRTLPYLKQWYDKYHDQGLEIIGVHTPEFAFEHVLAHVQKAVDDDGVKYPVVLDNDYGTWNAFGNQFWPRKYLIDSDGFIVYDHAGEGSYAETEAAIQKALTERSQILGDSTTISSGVVSAKPVSIEAGSPETYFGSSRNKYLGNGTSGSTGAQSFTLPTKLQSNMLYLGGTWNITPEYAESKSDAVIEYQYTAKGVYFVAGASTATTLEIQIDGAPIPAAIKGADIIVKGGKSYITVQATKLYRLIDAASASTHTIKILVPQAGLQAFTFTFG